MAKGKRLSASRMAICVASGVFVAAVVVACATSGGIKAFREVDNAAMRHDFDGALAAIDAGMENSRSPLYAENNLISLFLDTGMLRHFGGHFRPSSQDLLEAERLINEAFTRSVTADLLVWLSNDNAREYAGEDFEDIYLSVFNALNFYNRGDFEGAMVEIRKLTMDPAGKLPQLVTRYENARRRFSSGFEGILRAVELRPEDAMPPRGDLAGRVQDLGTFSDSALARYLSVIFYMANESHDSARIEYARLHEAFASNGQIYNHPIPAAAKDMLEIPAGKGRLNVLAFTGLSPTKEEHVFIGNFGFLVLHPLFNPLVPPGFSSPELQRPRFRLPIMVESNNVIDRVEVSVDGQSRFPMEPIEGIGRVVHATFNNRFADMYFRTFIRVLVRYIAADIAAAQAGVAAAENAGSPLAAVLAGNAARSLVARTAIIASDALEGADIRMGRFLPNMALVGAIDLDPGTHDVTVNYFSGGRLFDSENHRVEVRSGGSNLLQVVKLR